MGYVARSDAQQALAAAVTGEKAQRAKAFVSNATASASSFFSSIRLPRPSANAEQQQTKEVEDYFVKY